MAQRKVKYKKRNPQPTPPAEKPVKKASKKPAKKKNEPGFIGRIMIKLSESKQGRFVPYYILAAVVLVIGLTLFFKLYTPEEVTYDPAVQLTEPAEGEEIAVIETTKGVIKMRFFEEQAPKAVENFKTHAKNGYYDNLTFHRVVNDFMIQGGDPQGNGSGGESIWGEPFEDEFDPNLLNIRGAVSMANSGPNTNGSQFFINQAKPKDSVEDYTFGSNVPEAVKNQYVANGGNPSLDGAYSDEGKGHTVFGLIIGGMDVVDAIAEVEVNGETPVEEIKILSITFEPYTSSVSESAGESSGEASGADKSSSEASSAADSSEDTATSESGGSTTSSDASTSKEDGADSSDETSEDSATSAQASASE